MLPLAIFAAISNQLIAWANGGRLLFASDVMGQSTTRGLYRWRLSDANIVRMMDQAQLQAQFGSSNVAMNLTFNTPGVSDAGNDFDVFLSTRASTSQPWSAPSQVAELDTPSIEVPSWLSPDLCRLYLTTNRGGNYDIYLASRSP